jgi:hypothetical protein
MVFSFFMSVFVRRELGALGTPWNYSEEMGEAVWERESSRHAPGHDGVDLLTFV